ncbi:DUF397 domain-containing protein [Spiractinospora alimapuensis]|uniref:DUF397 domain-containing protein n=1 Tax=Spiractinospora alimapuensis TaxID=2820884 RepID=UPI001F3DFAE3|nr:DUF397 domain-containing protein [Spiractinospora alimapuensis]QVQ52802.1 DUF397 domain-containing protein [Spiractinospora alimapuensis]
MCLTFRTSSYSSAQENCVEVAPALPAFRKSSYSTAQDNCVEVAPVTTAFRTSTYSTGGENCVEVADLPTGAAIRDSKHPDAGDLAFTAREWGAFLTDLRSREL